MERVVEMKWKDRKREREIEARGQKRCSSSKANVTEKDGEWGKRPVFHLCKLLISLPGTRASLKLDLKTYMCLKESIAINGKSSWV